MAKKGGLVGAQCPTSSSLSGFKLHALQPSTSSRGQRLVGQGCHHLRQGYDLGPEMRPAFPFPARSGSSRELGTTSWGTTSVKWGQGASRWSVSAYWTAGLGGRGSGDRAAQGGTEEGPARFTGSGPHPAVLWA